MNEPLLATYDHILQTIIQQKKNQSFNATLSDSKNSEGSFKHEISPKISPKMTKAFIWKHEKHEQPGKLYLC